MIARVTSRIWVDAYLRRCSMSGASAFIVRRGDADAGAVIVKVATLDGKARLFQQSRSSDGELIWRESALDDERSEAAADAKIVREIEFDADLWVIEVEDKTGAHYLTEPVEEQKNPR